MANEAVLIFETAPAIPFTVDNATGIEKGSLLKMTDPMTAIINSGIDDVPAGIAKTEKIASDGNTKLAVYRAGIFRVQLSGSCTVGDALALGATANDVYTADVNDENIIGTALETGTNNETILMELNPRSNNLA